MNIQYPVALILTFFFAVGCGQSGPLYLPGDPSTIKTDAPRQDESQTEENDAEEDQEETPNSN
jgi:predicted small lipoprotein YifL